MPPRVLTQHQLDNIVHFKYCGGDTSPIYANVLSPLAQSLVDVTPSWVPPNVITFLGLVFSLISLALTMYYNPTLDRDSCPNWVHLVVAINLFLYQTLDNMDGKQARKTGSSSPLGMLFDHGIDAINLCLLVLPISSALGTGMNNFIIVSMLMALTPFYTTTWEEYYREEMVLGFINGPTEGLLTLMGFLVYTSIYGTNSLHEAVHVPLLGSYLPAEVTSFDLLLYVFVSGVVATVFPQLYTAALEGYRRKGQHPLRTFVTLTPFIVFFGSSYIWTLLSDIALKEKNYVFMTVMLMGSIFVEIVTHLMLAHMCKTPILVKERYTIWLPFLLAINVALLESGPVIDERLLIPPIFALSVLYSSVKFCQVCLDVADACNIYMFSLDKRVKVE